MKKLLLIALLSLAMTSCATLLGGTKKRVTFDGNASGPTTMIVDGQYYKNAKLPYKVNVKRGYNASEVRITVEGYEPVTIIVAKDFNPWSLLNLLDPIGWAIDLASGAVTQPEMDHYWVEFTPKAE